MLKVYLIFCKSLFFQIKKELILKSPSYEYRYTIRHNTRENLSIIHSSGTALISFRREQARNTIRGPEYRLYLNIKF